MTLTAEQLLRGAEAREVVEIPGEVLAPTAADETSADPMTVTLRPLSLLDLQKIERASQESPALYSVLMVHHALVEPTMSIDQVSRLHTGLVQFLLRRVNRLSGLDMSEDELESAVRRPLARACFVLAREFGWTPEECAELTLGQVLLYLEMIARGETPETTT
ncbi:MAG: hypothetical protein AAGD38_03200 [Acidobacteriota bacterium]